MTAEGGSQKKMAPEVGFEPTTKRLTAARSTTELLGNDVGCRAWIRTRARGSKVPRATTTQLGNTSQYSQTSMVPKVGLEPTRELPLNSF